MPREIDGWERARMARILDLNPRDKASWPMDLIDRLIRHEDRFGSQSLAREIHKLTSSK